MCEPIFIDGNYKPTYAMLLGHLQSIFHIIRYDLHRVLYYRGYIYKFHIAVEILIFRHKCIICILENLPRATHWISQLILFLNINREYYSAW